MTDSFLSEENQEEHHEASATKTLELTTPSSLPEDKPEENRESSAKPETIQILTTTSPMAEVNHAEPQEYSAERERLEPLTIVDLSESAASPTLESLLSPKEPDAHFPTRESVAVSDITDDSDAHFSTVPLSAHQSLDPSASTELATHLDAESADDKRNTKTLDGNDLVRLIHQNRQHKKTASTSTIHSANNVPFILGRVEDGDETSRRISLDGQQKLQEEFTRLQVERREEAQPAEVDWDFWGNVVSDYQQFASEHPGELAKAIERGIPSSLRGMIWQLMSASKDPELEETYQRLLKDTSPHEKAILRDLGRTFPHHAFFREGQGIGQENLYNVLKAYSLYDPQVGYCQGLPFVAAIFLLNMPDEEAFCLLVRFMHSYDLRGHFLPEMPKLQLRLFQFDRLIEEFLPVLHVHFLRQGIKSTMYCSQWFLTMFSYRFPVEVVFRIYDNCLASGIEAMFSFSLMLLYKNEDVLLSLKFDQLLAFLNTRVFEAYELKHTKGMDVGDSKEPQFDADQFVQDAVSLKITPFMLDTYAREYEEQVRIREAHATEMDALRNSNRNLSAQVNNLEESLSQLNAEHREVLTELVQAQARNDELESELVRYKLLYAEAMHQSEDALSSHRLSKAPSNRSSRSTSGWP